MLSNQNEKILSQLINLCSSGYKLLNDSDILCDGNLDSALKFLAEMDYIALKYCCNDDYLVKVLPKGREYFLLKDDRLLFNSILVRKSAITAFCGGLAGGITGCILIGILFFCLRWIYA